MPRKGHVEVQGETEYFGDSVKGETVCYICDWCLSRVSSCTDEFIDDDSDMVQRVSQSSELYMHSR